MKRQAGHWAVYGQLRLQREYCPSCQQFALVIKGLRQCCNTRVMELEANAQRKRMCGVEMKRRGPSKKYKDEQLKEQHNRCFYCDRRFGTEVHRHAKITRLRINWDHIDPFAFSLDNRNTNFVAACHVCNRIKWSLTFRSLDDAKTQIKSRWAQLGYRDGVSELSIEVSPETPLAKIL